VSRAALSSKWSQHLGLLVALSIVLSQVSIAPAGAARAADHPRPPDAAAAAPPFSPRPTAAPPSAGPPTSASVQALALLARPPTPAPTPTPTPEPAPILTVTLTVTPTMAAPGEPVALQVSAANLGPGPAAGVVFSLTLASAVEYQGPVGDAPGLSYDPQRHELTWLLGSVPAGVEGSFACTLQVAHGAMPGEHLFAASLSADPPAQGAAAQAWLWVELPPAEPVRLTPEDGGSLTSADGRVEILVPPEAVTETLLLSYQAVPTTTPELLWSFTLTATSEAGGWPVPALGRPMTLTLSLPDGAPPEVEPVRWDEAQGSWEVLPYQVLSPSLQLMTATPELGTFGLLIDTEGGQDGTQFLLGPSITGLQADLFTGGASFGYPIDLPPLPGSLGFSLGLSYSSEEADGMLTYSGEYTHTSQASWVGLGWSLSGLGRIYRSEVDVFLSFSGGSFRLVQEGGTWRTEPHSFLRIEHAGDSASFYHWDVWTPDGTKFVFGNPADAWYGGTAYTRWDECGPQWSQKRGYAWHLTRVEDTHANWVRIDYAHESGWYGVCQRTYLRSTRPTDAYVYPAGAMEATVHVTFGVQPREDWRLSFGNPNTPPWGDDTCEDGA